MHARVTILTGSPDRGDEEQGVQMFREQVVPFTREQGGRGAILLVDRASGNGMSITLWPDEETMRASEERASQLRADAAEEFGATEAPTVERYEVAVFEV